MALTTLLVFVIVICAVLYVVRFIPDPTIQKVVWVVVVVGALLWIVRNLEGLLHCCTV